MRAGVNSYVLFVAMAILLMVFGSHFAWAGQSLSYPIVDTNQHSCYDNNKAMICSVAGGSYYGQDAQYQGFEPRYHDNGDGTVSDQVTGLMWTKNAGDKMQYSQGIAKAKGFSYAGYNDWRVPSIKELYSLMDFNGMDVMPTSKSTNGFVPFINSRYFDFEYGDMSNGERVIDSQWITSTIYVSKVMNGQQCFFGVNFADGRIKCYETEMRRRGGWYLRLVRGNPTYGRNDFQDNNDGSVLDRATGLVWQKGDSSKGMNWGAALSYCENLSLAGRDDWRLPNAKELQSIVDYGRSPDATGSAAIDPVFSASAITNEKGQKDWAFYWSSTTHKSMQGMGNGAYISFGRALGNMNNSGWIDVHGAGAQRSDPKSGSPMSQGHGPQGDAQRVNNYVRCVRGGAMLTSDTVYDSYKIKSSAGMRSGASGGGRGMAPQGGGASGRSGRTPPQEAIRACSSKTQGSSCSFTTPRGSVSGSCRGTPDGSMACVPR